ncbi:4843_t:CDS:2 [Funneliformis mosseae]|uniref:4843_t:CDS:1 n=1 Tax=Funneliformis mosseae TaxID=27381 RepID=A0A9N9EX60_FUNMO|nr:4843_t:CDS:2 [Funneliformis mosseae]
MVNKKNKKVVRPWCWYCERDFEDEKVLVLHQKAKHFKCSHCNKKFNTAGGMVFHVAQVHKETIDTVSNALKGRESTKVEIFGMEGIPQADMIAHMRAIENKQPSKRVKVEEPMELSSEEIKKRLAQHQEMMKNNSKAGQYFLHSGYTVQQHMASLIPHQYSQFYQSPGVTSTQIYLPDSPYRPGQVPGKSLPWSLPVSGVSQLPYGRQIQPTTMRQSAVYPLLLVNNNAPASQIYSQVPNSGMSSSGQPSYAPYAANTVMTTYPQIAVPSDREMTINEIAMNNAAHSNSQPAAQKKVLKVRLAYNDNEVSMEEKRAEHAKYRKLRPIQTASTCQSRAVNFEGRVVNRI